MVGAGGSSGAGRIGHLLSVGFCAIWLIFTRALAVGDSLVALPRASRNLGLPEYACWTHNGLDTMALVRYEGVRVRAMDVGEVAKQR